LKGQKIIFLAIVSVVFVSLIFVLNYSSIYADESIIDVQLTVPVTAAVTNPFDTSKTIDPFADNTGIVFSSDSHKLKHPAPGKPGGGGGEPEPPGQDQDRIDVCHKGKTKSIDPDKLGDHLAHGDSVGPC